MALRFSACILLMWVALHHSCSKFWCRRHHIWPDLVYGSWECHFDVVWAPTKRGFKSKSSGTRLFSILLKSKSKTVRKEVNSWSCLIDCSFKIFYLINRLPILPKQWNQYFQFVPPLAVCLQTDTKHLRTTINFEVQYWLLTTKRNSLLCFEFFVETRLLQHSAV